MSFLPEPRHEHGSAARIGILVINLGTPDAPTPSAVRRYLREFLSDPRVVEIPRVLWWLILNGIILNVRPRQSAKKYALVWTPEGSPLKVHTEKQAQLLQQKLDPKSERILVRPAMRYGTPSIPQAITDLKAAGCDRILLLPLYPQYAASTTATALDAAFGFFARTRNVPELRAVRHFHDHSGYIRALANSIREAWAAGGRPHRLLMSFHGLPRYTLDRGDPYFCECQMTARLLAEELRLASDEWTITFQSRFGRTEWLQPYTAEVLARLPREGAGKVDVICPGFVSDCLETLEEIGIEGRATFLSAGGTQYRVIACLNERADWIDALAAVAHDHMRGWERAQGADDSRELARKRAIALGAQS